jgi:hypothetical protein
MVDTFKAHRIAAKRTIKALRNTSKGVMADIYYPLSANTRHGFQDDSLEYPDEPNLSEKVFIPSLFRNHGTNSFGFIVDPFGDDSTNFIYLHMDEVPYPLFSKISLSIANSLQVFRVEKWDTVNSGAGNPIYYRGSLSIVATIQSANKADTLATMIENENELVREGQMVDYSVGGESVKPQIKQFEPIG